MNSPTSKNWLSVLIFAVGVLIIAVCVDGTLSAISDAHTMGLLNVQSLDPRATISITQSNREAQTIGVGKARAHIPPGSYLVSVSDKGESATSVVRVYTKKTTKLTLNPSTVTLLPSASNINFENMGNLVDSGITATQASYLELALFKYSPTAKVIGINPSSIEPGPHNPNTSSGFTINFTLTINSTPYNATVSYSGLYTIELYLYNPQANSLVFDSGPL